MPLLRLATTRRPCARCAFLADHILSWFDTFQDLALLLLETRFYRGVLKISKGFFLEDAELLDAIAVELEQRLEAREER